MDRDWAALTPEEKLAERVKPYFEPTDVTFTSSEFQTLYQQRARRLFDALRVREPDRVPVSLPNGFFPVYYAGRTLQEVMYDYDALCQAFLKFIHDFNEDMDAFIGPALTHSGRTFELLGVRQFNWPGHGLGPEATTYQFVEGEYMQAEEYDTLIANPADFFFRTIAPRTLGALAPLTRFRSLASFLDKPMQLAGAFASADVRQAFQSLIAAGEELERWRHAIAGFATAAKAAGFPPWRSGMATAPFDTLGDSLRGTRGILTDMFRRPEKILAALEVITPLTIETTIASVNAVKGFMVAFPLHKGDDSHMSQAQFEKFYWPSLREVVRALIDEGILVMLFAEGRYTSRLEAINDFPKGWVSWHFDQTDMAKAKKVLGTNCCLIGNVPSSVMVTATPDQVRDCCRDLIDTCAPGGGYILAGGCSATESNPANFRAMMQAAQAYGRYDSNR